MKYRVQVLTITGKWVPYNAQWRLLTLAEASVDTLAANLKGMRSRIVDDYDHVVWERAPQGDKTLALAVGK